MANTWPPASLRHNLLKQPYKDMSLVTRHDLPNKKITQHFTGYIRLLFPIDIMKEVDLQLQSSVQWTMIDVKLLYRGVVSRKHNFKFQIFFL